MLRRRRGVTSSALLGARSRGAGAAFGLLLLGLGELPGDDLALGVQLVDGAAVGAGRRVGGHALGAVGVVALDLVVFVVLRRSDGLLLRGGGVLALELVGVEVGRGLG